MKPPHIRRSGVERARSERLAGVFVALLFLAGAGWYGWERVFFDGVSWLLPSRAAADEVAVVELDARSLEALGSWPWPRQHLIQLVEQLQAAAPHAVGIALPLHNADPVAAHMLRLQDPTAPVPRHFPSDAALAEAFSALGNVVLGVEGRPAAVPGTLPLRHQAAPPDASTTRSGTVDWLDRANGVYGSPPAATAPLAVLHRAVHGAGSIGSRSDADGRVRREVLWWRDALGNAFPSFALQLAAFERPQALAPELNEARVRTVLPAVYRARGGQALEIPRFSAVDVMAGLVPAERLSNRVVLVGLSAPGQAQEAVLVGRGPVPQLMAQAYTVSSLLEGDYLTVPDWAIGARLGALLLVLALLAWVFPGLGTLAVGVLGGLIAMGMVHTQLILHLQQGLWVPLVWPALGLLAGTGMLVVLRRVREAGAELQQRLDQTERELGKALQAQGRLEEAFERYQRCVMDGDLLDRLHALGIEYERRRGHARAVSVFRYIAAHEPEYGDVAQHIRRNRRLARVYALRAEAAAGKTNVGPYQLEREIGRGAMGAVYLAQDRRTRRRVALKTLALSAEFEAAQLDEVRTRFFREAEAAGRLNHPNIVAVHEVGEQKSVAYIAMDYLEGVDLQRHTQPGHLLPLPTVFDLMIQVADALGYAHSQGVVHRDIKPANMVYNAATGIVRVTDFGVASLTGAGKTRAGTILGSPSYMSPEQLIGSNVDGRSDLFSLGITFYQLLTGNLPFAGDSLPNIMYRITNEPHPDVRARRPDIPTCAAKIINKTLHKDPSRRYPDGRYLALMLRKCRANLVDEGNKCMQEACG